MCATPYMAFCIQRAIKYFQRHKENGIFAFLIHAIRHNRKGSNWYCGLTQIARCAGVTHIALIVQEKHKSRKVKFTETKTWLCGSTRHYLLNKEFCQKHNSSTLQQVENFCQQLPLVQLRFEQKQICFEVVSLQASSCLSLESQSP